MKDINTNAKITVTKTVTRTEARMTKLQCIEEGKRLVEDFMTTEVDIFGAVQDYLSGRLPDMQEEMAAILRKWTRRGSDARQLGIVVVLCFGMLDESTGQFLMPTTQKCLDEWELVLENYLEGGRFFLRVNCLDDDMPTQHVIVI